MPESWCWVRLQDIADYNGRPNVDPSNIQSDAWLLDLEDIEKDTSRLIYRASYAERESKSNKSIFKCGDVLYSKLRPYLNKVIVADIDGICTTEIVPITPTDAVGAEFLKCLLKSPAFLNYVDSLMYGVKMPRLGTEDAIKSVHPLPPLEEQHRIVAKVDKLMSLCDQLEQKSEASLAAHQTLVETLLATLTESADSGELAQNWARLAQHFDSLFTTQSSIDALKQTILQLAVMGKLVPQDPDDEPASVLLERIAAEKARLIKEGIYQKTSKLLQKKNIELPSGWVSAQVGELCPSIVPNRDKPKTFSGTIPWVTLPSFPVDSWYLDSKNVELGLTTEEVIKYSAKIIPSNSVLMSCVGRFGLSAINTIPVSSNQQVHAFIVLNGLSPEYLSCVIRVVGSHLYDMASATTIAYINKTKCESIQFGLPPTGEQLRIVAKVDELMSLCDQLSARLQASQTTQLQLAEALVEGALN